MKPVLERKIDELYREPLESFVAARNALTTRLKKVGEDDAALRVAELKKPSRPAWIVNQLYWESKRSFGKLIAAGEALRKLQQGSPGADALREADEKRRRALEMLRDEAHRGYAGDQEELPPALLRRVERTLEAIAALGPEAVDPPPGRLVVEIKPPGFGALFPLLPARPAPGAGASKSPAKSAAKKKVTKSGGATKKRADAAARKKAAAEAKRERELQTAQAGHVRARNELERRENVVQRVLADRERGRQEAQRARDDERQAKQRLTLARARIRKTDAELARVAKELDKVKAAVRRAKRQSDDTGRKLKRLERGSRKR